MEEDPYITIGVITKPAGIKGEVTVFPLTDFPERFATRPRIFARRKGEPKFELQIVHAREHGRMVLVQFAGIETLEEAERLRDTELFLPEAEAMPLPEGTYYTFELIGMDVVTEAGHRIGRLSDVWRMPAQDVYVVDQEGKEILIPALLSIIRKVDLAQRRMTVNLPDGLLEVYDCG
ncbi:MAG: ribosome maturation factor RimM [Candidatus Latescibacterota bacterium]